MYRVYFLLFIFFGCSSTLPDESISLAEHLKIGMDYLDRRKNMSRHKMSLNLYYQEELELIMAMMHNFF